MSLRAELRVLYCSCLSKQLQSYPQLPLIQLSSLSKGYLEGGHGDSSSKATVKF